MNGQTKKQNSGKKAGQKKSANIHKSIKLDISKVRRIGRTSCCFVSRSMPIEIRENSDNMRYVNQEPGTLPTRISYKRFGNYDRDFEYTTVQPVTATTF